MEKSVVLNMAGDYAEELYKVISEVLEYDEKTNFLSMQQFDTLNNLYEALQMKLEVEE